MSIPSATAMPRRPRAGAVRFAKLLILASMALAMLPISPVQASSNFGVVPGFPTVGAVGQTVSANLMVVNAHNSPITMTDLTFVPACSNFDVTCAGGIADPGAFTFSPTGTGQPGSACSDMTFNLTVVNAATGQIRVRRADNQNVSLTPSDIGSDLDICKVTFTIRTNRRPNHDAHPDLPDIQSNQNLSVSGLINGTVDNSTNNDVTTVAGPTNRMVTVNDFNGDAKSEVTVFGDFGNWMSPGQPTVYFGLSSDVAVPADYDGDRDVDRAVYRNGAWYVEGKPTVYFGLAGDIPVPGDYNGDGRFDRAVYRNGAWYVEGQPTVYYGLAGDIPVPADYDGDGNTERAVYRNGAWYVEGITTAFFGLAGDIPVPGDYNGDGYSERAIYRNGAWYIQGLPTVYLGMNGDVPVPGDYDGDKTFDQAVYRNGSWFGDGMPGGVFGVSSDVALGLTPAVYESFF